MFITLALGFQMVISPVSFAESIIPLADELSGETPDDESYTDCVDGEAIITLTLPEGADSPLLREGIYAPDPSIYVKDVMCFDSARELGRTKKQQSKLKSMTMYIAVVRSTTYTTGELIDILSDDAYVVSATPNRILKKSSLEPLEKYQWALGGEEFFGDDHYTDTNSSIGYTTEESIGDDTPIVAVIDDGIRFDHEELTDKMWVNPYPTLEGVNGYDFCNEDADPYPTAASDNHGTGIAGIIAADPDNGLGIAGVCDNVKLMSLKLFDTDTPDMSGAESVELQCYEYIYNAMKLGANVVAINCSFGSEPTSTPDIDSEYMVSAVESIQKKIGSLGAIFVYAAGNYGIDLTQISHGMPFDYCHDYSLIVGATTSAGEAGTYSNYGTNLVDMMAPGSMILSTTGTDTYLPEIYDEAKRETLCSLYDEMSSSSSPLYSYSDLVTGKNSAISISHRNDFDFYSSKSGGSYGIALLTTRNPSRYAYTVFYDVTSLDLDVNNEYWFSFDYCWGSEGAQDWSHYFDTIGKSRFVSLYSLNDHVYMGIDIKALFSDITNSIGDIFMIDNLSISIPDPDTAKFGKYNYMSGTSFSAPYVSGAIARLANVYPGDNAATRKQKLLASVKKSDALANVCASGGSLDISAFSTLDDINIKPYKYKVTKITLSKKNAKLKVGKKLKLIATIVPDYATNKKVTWKISNKKYATITQKGVVKAKKKGKGHTVTVTAKAKDGSGKKATCRITIKKK